MQPVKFAGAENDNKLATFCLQPVDFLLQRLTDDDFAQSPDYDQLYTELTGAVALFIESNGVQ